MAALPVVKKILDLLTFLCGLPSDTESKRILKGKIECLSARIDDSENIERASCLVGGQGTKKRKRDDGDDLSIWRDEGKTLLGIAQSLLTQLDEGGSFLFRAKKRKDANNLMGKLALYEKKSDVLYTRSLCDTPGPNHGYYIPVKALIGQATLNALTVLKHLLQADSVQRVAIRGELGIGKTFMMKHLHNAALKWVEKFDYVFWVTSPADFTIKHMQDAIAAVLKCDFASDDDLNSRATILSNTFAALGSCVLFLDGVPDGDLSLAQIGIPILADGSECKLVVTTSSALGSRVLNGFVTVELNRLSEEDALKLFMHEANIGPSSVTLLRNIPCLLARKCCGIPCLIVDIASRMYGIDDLHEWNNALFEIENIEANSHVRIHERAEV
ncbi:probable disease resistance protein At5g47250 [Amaranthus tricolor]|uniref:probable disease resistance protein At5g47250 n=1 Tax=Amaranthus tricolor TaxID=29722 RepID=UPI00258AB639|nr:probable disease resistance protein At5g47250 [Amaranthus tricolor]